MAAGVALKVANLGSLVRSAQAPRFSEGDMSQSKPIANEVYSRNADFLFEVAPGRFAIVAAGG
jgi:hypothetical protein